ncbi:hypothetical protein [Bacillus sp. Marseille-P3661]|uniref:hypothetical protein n=1 Tax=Bacillus sp. Marseille-P3661 TaxID=1936234 RepID=UPI0015E15C77|nr:hypothetical protein [Bacillus sp. Marseille-P3661]
MYYYATGYPIPYYGPTPYSGYSGAGYAFIVVLLILLLVLGGGYWYYTNFC